MKPATFKDLHLAESKVNRALAALSLPDRKRVLDAVMQQINEVAAAPAAPPLPAHASPARCLGIIPGSADECSLYAGHTGACRS